MFISFEGVDGAGKGEQIKRLTAYLDECGVDYILTREPGGTPLAESIRQLLLDRTYQNMDKLTELFLFEAARRDHVQHVILPALAAGKVVICDRFTDSSWVYQGYAGELGVETVETLNALATGGREPDRVIVLDLPVAIARERQGRRAAADRIEAQGDDYHERVRQGYQKRAAQDPERVRIVDASPDPETIHAEILAILAPLLQPAATAR